MANWCIGSILASAATFYPVKVLPSGVLVKAHDLHAGPGESEEHQPDHDPRPGVENPVEDPTDDDPAQRIPHHRRGDLHATVAPVDDRLVEAKALVLGLAR